MRTIKLVLQYDGGEYAGWQVQDNATTIQELVEGVLTTVLREKIRVSAASRTDSGVHALANVAAFKTANPFPLHRLRRALNGILPPDIRVTEIGEAEAGFVPRYAKEKTYRYTLACGESLSPFQRRYAWHVRERLDFDAMQKAAEAFIGEHDFTSFTAAGGGEKTHIREIYRFDFGHGGFVNTCIDDEEIYHFDIAANGFLYKMVRNIIGTLVEVGRGKTSAEEIPRIIEAKDRALAGPTAPPHGLCLLCVKY
ncbi:MAG: tRNA pseudouridine(38-40) synthase TruA [Candidatus Lindowbacteria bacterium]|nr:tRNA pseudouridine(38-40) synthase TruA [Candidatus Lindowbacteria bacterium]